MKRSRHDRKTKVIYRNEANHNLFQEMILRLVKMPYRNQLLECSFYRQVEDFPA